MDEKKPVFCRAHESKTLMAKVGKSLQEQINHLAETFEKGRQEGIVVQTKLITSMEQNTQTVNKLCNYIEGENGMLVRVKGLETWKIEHEERSKTSSNRRWELYVLLLGVAISIGLSIFNISK